MRALRDKVALVTGGSRDISAWPSRRFVAQGAWVVITGRDQTRLDDAVAQIRGEVGVEFAGALTAVARTWPIRPIWTVSTQ